MARRRVVIVHGWRGRADRGWLGWLAGELRDRGFEVINPQLANRINPKLDDWLEMMQREVGKSDVNTVFVGHSMGCRIILRYLEEQAHDGHGFMTSVVRGLLRQSRKKLARGLVLVAGFYELDNKRSQDYFGPDPNFRLLKSIVSRSTCIFSDNDQIVKPAASEQLAEALGAEKVEIVGRGHFGNNENRSLDEALDAVLGFWT